MKPCASTLSTVLAATCLASSAHAQSLRYAYAGITPTTLTHAITVIQHMTHGRVLEIRVLHGTPPGFLAVVAKGRELVNVRVTSRDEVARVSVNAAPRWMLGWRLRADMSDIRRASLSPEQAVRKAEQAMQATAVDAELAKPISAHNGVLAYNVELVKRGQLERVAIDARSGEIIADPQRLLGPWSPEKLVQQDLRRSG